MELDVGLYRSIAVGPEIGMIDKRVLSAVADRRHALLSFVEKLVNLDSPTEYKKLTDVVGDLLQAKAESLGMECSRDVQTRYGDNRVCRWRSRSSTKVAKVLLIGHFDTVYEPGDAASRPFRVDGDIAFGPGVLDMKGGLAVALFSLEALLSVHGDLGFDATLILNSDEEIGSPASRELIAREAPGHDLSLVFEPGNPGPSLTTSRKGIGFLKLRIDGVEAHAGAEPEKGVNSIVEMANLIPRISNISDLGLGTTVMPGVIVGGTKPYVVPGTTELTIDCRVKTNDEQKRVQRSLESLALQLIDKRASASVTGRFHREPMVPTTETLEVVAQIQVIADEIGFSLSAGDSGGASDANLTASMGIPTVDGLGPHGGRAHSAEEYIEISTLEAKCKIVACFLDSLRSSHGMNELKSINA